MRRVVVESLVILGLILATSASALAGPGTDGWQPSTPEEQGIDSVKLAEGFSAIHDSGMPIHSLVLVHDGKLVLDADFYPYDGAVPHDLASVTKSVTTTLIGIAIDQGKLRLSDPVLSFFPDRTIANRDDRKDRMTVANLASMTSGLACTEAHDEQTLQEMMASPDWIQFTLDLPMAAEPGSTYSYCSPGMHLLSAILTKATGMTELAFAQRFLFGPLGISGEIWPPDPQGITHGWGDLHLYPLDAAKLGQLWLNGGVWNGTQVVSQGWVADSVRVHAKMGKDAGEDYGYGWHIPRQSSVGGEYAAVGRGGQEIRVFPALHGVVVTTAGGIDPSKATDLLAPAIVKPTTPLPPNPEGVAHLRETLAHLAAAPVAQPPLPLPAIAQAISGAIYAFGPNPLDLATLRLDFAQPTEATMAITFNDGQAPRTVDIGLDGVYRLSPGRYGLPSAQRGTWTDGTTFVLEYNELANIDSYTFQMRFSGHAITIDGQELTHSTAFQLAGASQAG